MKANLTRTTKAIRLFLGLLFLSTGVMKYIVPELRAAFSGQLTAAGIPFHAFNMWIVPATEIVLGAILLLGFLPRLAGLTAIAIMAVATYVHLAVNDPSLFPLQPQQPIIPAMVMAASILLLRKRGGAWNAAYRKQRAGNRVAVS